MNMKKILVENQIEKVKKLDISVLLVEQTKSKEASCLPVSATCNRTLSNIKNITSATLAPVENRPNIGGHISTNANTSVLLKSKPKKHYR